MDVDSIALGRDFRSVLQQTLASCDVMLVLIDKNWAEGHANERLKDSDDYVRMEIEAALKRDIFVTPILLRGANMPTAEQLPDEIGDLAYRNAFELSHNRWESDVQELIRRLGLDATGASPPRAHQPAAGAEQGIKSEPVRKALFHRRLFWVAPAALVLAAIIAVVWGDFTMTREATDSGSSRTAGVDKKPPVRGMSPDGRAQTRSLTPSPPPDTVRLKGKQALRGYGFFTPRGYVISDAIPFEREKRLIG